MPSGAKRHGREVAAFNVAGIAQLVEQRIRNAWVGGSIPLSGTIFLNNSLP